MYWFNDVIYNNANDGLSEEGDRFNGYACYKLRCELLHQGSVDIDNILNKKPLASNQDSSKTTYWQKYLADQRQQISKDITVIRFELSTEEKGFPLASSFSLTEDGTNKYVNMKISVKDLCQRIISETECFYRQNKDYFDQNEEKVIVKKHMKKDKTS